MKRFDFFLVLILINLTYVCSFSQSITTSPLSEHEFCPGTSFEVGFIVSGSFQPDNLFFVEFSNTNFTNFDNIGNLKSTESGNITVTLPEKLNPSQNYRLRVCSTKPYIEGSDNGSDIIVYAIPKNDIHIERHKYFYNVNEEVNFSLNDITWTYNPVIWNFGDDANPQTFMDFEPPPVTYNSFGKKNITFEIKPSENCIYSTKCSNSICIYNHNCEIIIDSSAFVADTTIYSDDTLKTKDSQQTWILPIGSVNIESAYNSIFIIETGGSLNIRHSSDQSVFYLKPGASLSIVSVWAPDCLIFKTPGSSVMINLSDDNTTTIDCDSLHYNYSTAPKDGIEILERLGYLDVKDGNLDKITFSIIPNPANERAEIVYYLNEPANVSLSLQSLFGESVIQLEENMYKNAGRHSIELNTSTLPSGVYYVLLNTANKYAARKISIVK